MNMAKARSAQQQVSPPVARPTSTKRQSSRCWCFTINNDCYSNIEIDLSSAPTRVFTYCVMGDEIGDDGTPHVQGFIIMNVRTEFTRMKVIFPRAHIEVMKGNSQQAADYCKKDGDFTEIGTFEFIDRTGACGGMKGGPAKAAVFKQAIKLSKAGDFDKMEEELPHMYWNHYSTMKRIAMDNPPKVNDLEGVCGEWIWGPPGTGKSHTARSENPNYYDKACNKGWEGYMNQDVAIMDDFDKVHHVLGHYLKRWGDKYPFQADIKYSNTYIRPKKIVITSNYKIEDIFWEDLTLQEAILRRFKVREFNTVYVKPIPQVVIVPNTPPRAELIDLLDDDDHIIIPCTPDEELMEYTQTDLTEESTDLDEL